MACLSRMKRNPRQGTASGVLRLREYPTSDLVKNPPPTGVAPRNKPARRAFLIRFDERSPALRRSIPKAASALPRAAAVQFRQNAMRYIAHAVDLRGVSLAMYEIEGADEDELRRRVRPLLEVHPAIEVWDGPRLVMRVARGQASETKGRAEVPPR